MTVSIDTSSIDIAIHAADMRPLVRIFNKPFKIRNTSFTGSAAFFTHNKEEKAPTALAFTAEGRVSFSMGPGDSLKDWKVGFVQIVRETATRTRYAGRTPLEGSIVCNAVRAFGQNNVLLDSSNPAFVPFADKPDGISQFKGSVATPHTGDAPSSSVPLFMQNSEVSNVNNFLYDYLSDDEFWTILTAIGPGQSPQFLAHINWRIRHKVDFFWRSGVPVPSQWGSFKISDKFVAGPPQDADLQRILKSPTGPLANVVLGTAFQDSLVGNDFFSHSEFVKRAFPNEIGFLGGSPA